VSAGGGEAMVTTFHEVHGLTREQLRRRVDEAARLRLMSKQREVGEELLRLGEEFKREQRDQERERARRRPLPSVPPPSPPVELAQHRQPERCATLNCPNVATIDIEVWVGGEVVRRGFCDPHAGEYLVERAS
jgi:hypothetical protein